MKKSILRTISLVAVFVFVLLLSSSVTSAGDPSSGGLVPCGITTPCTLCHFIVGIHNLVRYGMYLVIALAVLAIFFAGITYILSSGNEGLMTTAKGFLKGSFIGFAVVLGGFLIITAALRVMSAKDDLGIGRTGSWASFSCSTASSALAPGTTPATAPPDASGSISEGGVCNGMSPGVGTKQGTCQKMYGTGGSGTDALVCPNRSWRMQQATDWRQCATGLGCCDPAGTPINGILDSPCGTGNAGICTKITGTYVLPSSACVSVGKVPVSGGTFNCLSGLWCCKAPSGDVITTPDITP